MSAVAKKVTRFELVAEYQRLLDVGWSRREVAEHFGKHVQSVHNLLSDPDGSKQRERRKRYQGICIDCGAPTDGSNGRKSAPKRCNACANAPWTHCAKGHVLTPENRLFTKSGAAWCCRLCRNAWMREFSARRRREAGVPERGPYLSRRLAIVQPSAEDGGEPSREKEPSA